MLNKMPECINGNVNREKINRLEDDVKSIKDDIKGIRSEQNEDRIKSNKNNHALYRTIDKQKWIMIATLVGVVSSGLHDGNVIFKLIGGLF